MKLEPLGGAVGLQNEWTCCTIYQQTALRLVEVSAKWWLERKGVSSLVTLALELRTGVMSFMFFSELCMQLEPAFNTRDRSGSAAGDRVSATTSIFIMAVKKGRQDENPTRTTHIVVDMRSPFCSGLNYAPGMYQFVSESQDSCYTAFNT
jgi:hypothetical protein